MSDSFATAIDNSHCHDVNHYKFLTSLQFLQEIKLHLISQILFLPIGHCLLIFGNFPGTCSCCESRYKPRVNEFFSARTTVTSRYKKSESPLTSRLLTPVSAHSYRAPAFLLTDCVIFLSSELINSFIHKRMRVVMRLVASFCVSWSVSNF